MENTKSVSFYDEWLRERPAETAEVNSLSDYFNAITAINKTFPRNLFRGQANKDWKIESSAYRCINKPTVERLRDYHEKLISEVTDLRDCELYKGLEMVAHLQHNGAKTVFIDYTQNPLVALWFACTAKEKSEKEAEACVYCMQESNINYAVDSTDDNAVAKLFEKRPDSIYKFIPPQINRRIPAQQSVFLINLTGKIEKYLHKTIVISAKNKQSILNELASVGISQKTLFHDFSGFVEWFVYDEKEKFDSLIFEAGKDLEKANYKAAQTNLQKAIQLGDELKLSDSETASLYNSFGQTLYKQGNYPEALVWYNKALTISEKVLGKEHPSTATTYNNIAVVYDNMGKYPLALEWYEKDLKISEKVLGKEHPDTATTYNNIAGVYNDMGDYNKALEWYNKALAIREKVLGKEHPETATTYNNIALVYHKMGEYPTALEWYEKALTIFEKVLGKEHPDTATTYNNIAGVYDNMGNYPKALEWNNKALAIRETVLGKEHPDTATTYNNIALVYKNMGKYPEALEWVIKAYAILKRTLGFEHPNTKTVFSNMADAYKKSNNPKPFKEWLEEKLAGEE